MKRRISIAVGMVAVAAFVTMSSSGVFAGVTDAPQSTQVGILGVGQQVSVLSNFVQVDMKPIPGTDAPNTGLARPGDNIAAICHLPDSRGQEWVLGLNRNGRAGQQYTNTVGFIPRSTLDRNVELSPCTYYDANWATIGGNLYQVDMKPIAGTDAPNTGLARSGDQLGFVCSLADSRGMSWILVINLDGGRAGAQYPDTVGFVPAWTLVVKRTVYGCGAT